MVPCLRTMMLSSAMAGTYAPPAVQEPITTAIWGGEGSIDQSET